MRNISQKLCQMAKIISNLIINYQTIWQTLVQKIFRGKNVSQNGVAGSSIKDTKLLKLT